MTIEDLHNNSPKLGENEAEQNEKENKNKLENNLIESPLAIPVESEATPDLHEQKVEKNTVSPLEQSESAKIVTHSTDLKEEESKDLKNTETDVINDASEDKVTDDIQQEDNKELDDQQSIVSDTKQKSQKEPDKNTMKTKAKPSHEDLSQFLVEEDPFEFSLLDVVEVKTKDDDSQEEESNTSSNVAVKEAEGEKVEETKIVQLTEEERQELYKRYDELNEQYLEQKAKNGYLLKKLATFYQKRKMFHVLQEGNVKLDALKKYEKQLEEYERLGETSILEQAQLENEIKEMKETCTIKQVESQKVFEKLQHIEYESVKEIITSKTCKGYEEKLVDHYLKRQKIQLSTIKKIRLEYIKIRNKLNETQIALDSLDNLGPNFRLIDYEQLKHDNRNLNDKLEERVLELTNIRRKCQNTMQVLAHLREKIAAINIDNKQLNDTLDTIRGEYEEIREQLNNLKLGRDNYRSRAEIMKTEAGLLMKPKLLSDLTHTIEENNILKSTAVNLKEDCILLNDKLKKLKNNMKSSIKLNRIKEQMRNKNVSNIDVTFSAGLKIGKPNGSGSDSTNLDFH